ncbi:hypothetical protein [Phenylobacterium sp.]|uniref:hypothetical protein n=1 Tax=Phenylobacterium sp. TaxID=1871053 RepID=UPI002FC78A33
MKDIIDIAGASGALYRFRRHAKGRELPATAGNFLYVRQTRQGFDLICCGETSTLNRAYGLWDQAREDHQTTHVFLRLNVTSATRRLEHADIVALHRPPLAPSDQMGNTAIRP